MADLLPSLAPLVAPLIPAAVFLVLVLALRAALGRWWDRVPAAAAAGFAAVVLALFGGALFGGGTLLPLDNLRGHPPFLGLPPTEPHGNLLQGDLILLIEPSRQAVGEALAAGAWPLWNPRVGLGMPLLADPQAQALQPLTWPELLLGAFDGLELSALGLTVALRTYLALLFTFLWLRRLGAGPWPAAGGALAFGLGGFLQLWAGWPLASTASLLPLTLYALTLADERGHRRDWALLTGASTALLLAGHPETVLYGLGVVAALAAVRGWQRAEGRAGFFRRVGAAGALAGLLAAPALLPFLGHLPETLRWARAGEGESVLQGAPPAVASDEPGPRTPHRVASLAADPAVPTAAPATRLVQALAPNALGNSRYVDYWGLRNSNEDAAGFVGTATLLLALWAGVWILLGRWLGGGRGSREVLRHEGLALLAAAGVAVLLVLPAGFLGLIGPWGASGRLVLVLNLALALLAAAGLERLARGLPASVDRRGAWWAAGTALALALLLALGHLAAYRGFQVPGAAPGEPPRLDLLRWGFVHWHLRFLAGTALVIACARLRPAGFPLGRALAPPVLALALAAELLLVHGPVYPEVTPETRTALQEAAGGETASGLPAPGPLRHLSAAGEPERTAPRIAPLGRALPPNLASLYGLSDVRAFNPMAPADLFMALEPVITGWEGEAPLLGGETTSEPGDPSLYDRLGVGQLLLGPGEPCPAGSVESFTDPAGTVCRRPGSRSLVGVESPGGVVRVAPQPVRGAWAAGGSRWQGELEAANENGAGKSRTLITSIWSDGGWRALVDGRPVEVSATEDLSTLTAELPAGAGRVDLLYRPGSFLWGALLAALGVLGGLLWWWPPPR